MTLDELFYKGKMTMKSFELEIKQLITKEVYNFKLSELIKLSSSENFVQVNYYYDTPEYDIFNKNETLRIRLKDSGLKLERKCNNYYINDTRVCEEYSRHIDFLPQSIIIDHNHLNLIGCMVTARTNFKFDNCVISLDKNYYLGKIDYEIEIESNEVVNIPIQLSNIINHEEITPGKYTRFISTLNDIKKCDTYRVESYF